MPDLFSHLTRRCFTKSYQEMCVWYILQGFPITGVSIIKGVIGEAKRQQLRKKCSYLVLSMFVSVPHSVRR